MFSQYHIKEQMRTSFQGTVSCYAKVSLPSLPEPEPEWSRTCSPASEAFPRVQVWNRGWGRS